MTQRIVIPIEDNQGKTSKIAPHFGRAQYFAIIELSGRGKITNIDIEKNNTENKDGTANPYENLVALRPAVIITCEMSMGSLHSFQDTGIQVLKAEGSVLNEVMSNFTAGKLYPLAASCTHTHEQLPLH